MPRSQHPPVSPARRALIAILSSILVATALFQPILAKTALAAPSVKPAFKLGNEVLFSRFHHLIEGKRVGLITNQTGVNSKGVSTIDALAADPTVQLTALYGPEHGIDGQAKAGAYVASYTHPTLGIPVYSLYGETRMPTEAMLKDIDVLLFDVQEIGARTYTYASTLNYAMKAAAQYGKKVVVLDRPNPIGGVIVEGPVLDEGMETFVGVDNLPMAHGMTIGELARLYNREIGADLTVVPMEGYTRETIWQDTGLPWIPTSPLIKTVDSAFCYMATGLGEGTGIYQADFTWIGGKNIDSNRFAQLMNAARIPGVKYVPEVVNGLGGVRLNITDYRTFNPVKSGLYALAYARQLVSFTVPKSTATSVVMFDKIQGTSRVGQWLEQKLPPQTMESRWQDELAAFKKLREKYLIYGYTPDEGLEGRIDVIVDNTHVFFDTDPYINGENRTMVPVRAIAEALGAQVTWDGARYAVTISRNGRTVELLIGNATATVNGVSLPMDTAPLIKDDRTMVPLRFVSEFLGATVDWDDATRTVIVAQ